MAKRMTDDEVMLELRSSSRLNQARVLFASEVAKLEQADAFGDPLPIIERRRREFEAVKLIAAGLGVTL